MTETTTARLTPDDFAESDPNHVPGAREALCRLCNAVADAMVDQSEQRPSKQELKAALAQVACAQDGLMIDFGDVDYMGRIGKQVWDIIRQTRSEAAAARSEGRAQ